MGDNMTPNKQNKRSWLRRFGIGYCTLIGLVASFDAFVRFSDSDPIWMRTALDGMVLLAAAYGLFTWAKFAPYLLIGFMLLKTGMSLATSMNAASFGGTLVGAGFVLVIAIALIREDRAPAPSQDKAAA
jgi:hypothetical protein